MSLCFIMLNKCYDCCLSLTVYLINQRCDVFLALYHFINHVYEITRIRQTYTLLANLLLHRTFVILFPEIMSSKDAKFVSHIYLCKCVPYNDSTRTTDRAHCIWRMCVCVFWAISPLSNLGPRHRITEDTISMTPVTMSRWRVSVDSFQLFKITVKDRNRFYSAKSGQRALA